MRQKLTELYDFDKSTWEELIDRWIFNERARGMLRRRLLDGQTLEEIAGEFERSVTQTKNIIYKAEDKLFRHIK